MDPEDPTVRPVRYFHLTPDGAEIAKDASEQYDIVNSQLKIRPAK